MTKKLVLLTIGNKKLGPGTATFNLPAGIENVGGTCPGASEWCGKYCYAKKLLRIRPSVRTRYSRNLEWINKHGCGAFVSQISKEIRHIRPGILRIHASGDFYSPAYALAWAQVVRDHPDVKFWAYTRSWRLPAVRKALESMQDLPNMQLWASWDPSMEAPPEGWRVAGVPDMPDGLKAMTCLNQLEDRSGEAVRANCADCGFCFEPPKAGAGHVKFIPH